MSRAMQGARNYHRWVFESFADLLPAGTVLEIGSGHGMYSRLMAPRVDRLIVSDVDPLAVERIRHQLRDLDNVECLAMDGIEPDRLPGAVDAVVLVNLLEHIQHDGAFLTLCAQVLRPQGLLILFVPACAGLYSRMDREAGHYRRYQRRMLTSLLTDSGFQVQRARYFNSIGFFGWYLNKLLGTGIHSPAADHQIEIYDGLIPALKYADYVLPFLGQSLAVAARPHGCSRCYLW